MKQTKNLVLVGQHNVRLVPYESIHVPRYHQWLKDPYILEMTASEPVSLKEEYEWQKTWEPDDTKCTFLISITDKSAIDEVNKKLDEPLQPADPSNPENGCIIGDINLYIVSNPDEPLKAEVDVMIAEKECWRHGYAQEALRMFMKYGATVLGIKIFEARILMTNKPSINLFHNKLGFSKVSVSEIFKEVHFELDVSDKKSHAAQMLQDVVIKQIPFHKS